MTQASLAPRPFTAAPLHDSACDQPGESSEDPDSPGPHPSYAPSPAAAISPAVPVPSHRDPGPDPLAEALVAALGTALALLTFGVPLLAVFAERQADSSRGQPSPGAPTTILLGADRRGAQPIRSERIDHRPTAGRPTGP